jgi:hypothetical protein
MIQFALFYLLPGFTGVDPRFCSTGNRSGRRSSKESAPESEA